MSFLDSSIFGSCLVLQIQHLDSFYIRNHTRPVYRKNVPKIYLYFLAPCFILRQESSEMLHMILF